METSGIEHQVLKNMAILELRVKRQYYKWALFVFCMYILSKILRSFELISHSIVIYSGLFQLQFWVIVH